MLGGCLRALERAPGGILEADTTSELTKRTKSFSFEIPFRHLSDTLASPCDHPGAPGAQKVSSLKALDSGSDSGLSFVPLQMCSGGLSLQSQLDFHISSMSENG